MYKQFKYLIQIQFQFTPFQTFDSIEAELELGKLEQYV